MEEGEIIYVERNADSRDHRVPGRVVRPGTVTPTRVFTTPQVPAAAPVYSASPVYSPAPVYPQSWYGGAPYAAPMWNGPWGGLFGGVNTGRLVDLAAQGFAAIRSLPAAPASTGDVTTDVGNLITYQQALSDHAKVDERIRTVAHILGTLLGG